MRAKIGYVELPLELQLVYPGIKGFFKKLNVYPLKESLYTFDEVIEDSKDNYTRVLRLAYQEDNK